MAALDFPASPTLNQLATLTNGFTYQWDGAVWTLAAATGQQAGGDLTGTYPNPSVGHVDWSKLTTGSIAAGGDLAGSTYPNPTLVPAQKNLWSDTGTNLTPVTTTRNLQVGSAAQKAVIEIDANGGFALSVNHPWGPGDATKASWLLQLETVTPALHTYYRAPNAGVGAVTDVLKVLSDGKTYCTLADNSVNANMMTKGAAFRQLIGENYTYPAGTNINTTALTVLIRAVITTSGGPVLAKATLAGRFYPNVTGLQYYVLDIVRDGSIVAEWVPEHEIPAGSFTHGFPVLQVPWAIDGVGAGTHTYEVSVRVSSTNNIYKTGVFWTGTMRCWEMQ